MRGKHQGSPARSIKTVFQTFSKSLENAAACRRYFFDKLNRTREGAVFSTPLLRKEWGHCQLCGLKGRNGTVAVPYNFIEPVVK